MYLVLILDRYGTNGNEWQEGVNRDDKKFQIFFSRASYTVNYCVQCIKKKKTPILVRLVTLNTKIMILCV